MDSRARPSPDLTLGDTCLTTCVTGCSIEVNRAATRVHVDSSGVRVDASDGATFEGHAVVVTAPSYKVGILACSVHMCTVDWIELTSPTVQAAALPVSGLNDSALHELAAFRAMLESVRYSHRYALELHFPCDVYTDLQANLGAAVRYTSDDHVVRCVITDTWKRQPAALVGDWCGSRGFVSVVAHSAVDGAKGLPWGSEALESTHTGNARSGASVSGSVGGGASNHSRVHAELQTRVATLFPTLASPARSVLHRLRYAYSKVVNVCRCSCMVAPPAPRR